MPTVHIVSEKIGNLLKLVEKMDSMIVLILILPSKIRYLLERSGPLIFKEVGLFK